MRLKRADLPEQNLTATFDRMKAEREREAADERARGNEAAQRVRAQADRTAIEIVSEAERDAQIIRGESDAERNRILAEAYGADQEFFAFLRSMDAYRRVADGRQRHADGRARQRLLRLPALAGAADAAGIRAPPPATASRRRRRAPARGAELIGDLLLGLGLVAIVEGLVLALAPVAPQRGAGDDRRGMDPERRRLLGLAGGDRRRRPCLGGAGVKSCAPARRRDLPAVGGCRAQSRATGAARAAAHREEDTGVGIGTEHLRSAARLVALRARAPALAGAAVGPGRSAAGDPQPLTRRSRAALRARRASPSSPTG